MYHYFANRDEMLVAVAAEVSAKLHAVLLTASEGLKPKQSIRAMVKAYMSFARDHHLLYEVLVIPRPASGRDAVAPELLWLFLVSQVTRLSGEADSPESVERRECTILSRTFDLTHASWMSAGPEGFG
jgi:AcrR family transcriptional regulator